MIEMSKTIDKTQDLENPVVIPPEAYISRDYAEAEQDRLFRKVWLQAGRLEDLREVGDFITYNIGPDSVIIVKSGEGELSAYHNVCPHRGRRLVDTPEGKRNARGTRKNFICGYHGWTFGLDGENTYIEHEEDWQGSLCAGRADLGKVHVDTWGGWIWINLDPDCKPLREYLGVIPEMLDPYQLENMRPRWRKWIIFDCNWKVAMEAFAETYHVSSTHPEFNAFGQFRGWARNHGLHTNIGYEAPKGMEEDSGKMRVGSGADPRLTTAEMQNFTWENANTNTTAKLVEVANRLKDELPEGTPAAEVSAHWIKTAREEDAARGVNWPNVAPEHTAKAGTAWQVFPNFQIGQAVQNMLCYHARPFGNDPDKCYFEAAVYELYPEGEAPETEWEYTKPHEWPPVLQQDFANMAAVQQGMKNAGFRGAQVNPYMERAVASLHLNLSRYMGTGAPRPRN
ncbi:aromatic ring-hydroxylating dioxygenase subunit alpha [Erythrobacter alti]|uniref:aromatic ring-hydroxylating oxygenase subunit alpha n=1 Tax=Erythrobacter alti TaxID=1896145 RepID=UPI0030F3F3D2